jgi:hypothetical protein
MRLYINAICSSYRHNHPVKLSNNKIKENQMSKMVSNRITMPALLVTGLLSQASTLQAATVDLVFSTYTTQYDGTFTVSLDTSVVDSYALSTAYNNATEYEERLITNIVNGEYNSLGYEQLSVTFDQIYTTYGNDSSSMTTGLFISENTRTLTPLEVEYTGNLPPAYQTDPGNAITIVDRQVAFYLNRDQGALPLFTDPSEDNIPQMFNDFSGLRLSLYINEHSSICEDYDETYDICNNNLGSTHQSTDGYAYLESVSVSSVPVPAAVWLFGSGLIGLAGIARRKKQ